MLHLINNLDVGGAQEVVRSLVPALRALGVDASVATLRDGPLRGALEADDVPVAVLGGRTRSIVGDPRGWVELRHLYSRMGDVVDDRRADVVQTHLMRSLDFVALGLRRRPSHPSVIWTFHNARLELRADQLASRSWLLRPKRTGYQALYRRASRRAGALVAVSDDVARAVREAIGPSPARVVTIPNGVDTARYGAPDGSVTRRELGLPDDGMVLACVAKFHEQKGHRVLVQAVADLPPTEVRVHLMLLGDGPLRGEIEAMVHAAGMADRVHFLGTRQDIPSVLRLADGLVLPSLWEGLPMALLEAMASGLPVIATSVSGTRQVVTNDETGLLVEAGDSRGLGAAIGRLTADPALRQRLGDAGRSVVQSSFSVEAQARRHLDLYRSLLQPRSGAPS